MTLWLILALMTAATILAVLGPLFWHAGTLRSGSDIEVYRDQLSEIDRDQAAGLIGKTEAEAARVEISRRLIAAADAAAARSAPKAKPPLWCRRAVVVAALVALPIGAISLYLVIGSPFPARSTARCASGDAARETTNRHPRSQNGSRS